jgi:hypothetical protein
MRSYKVEITVPIPVVDVRHARGGVSSSIPSICEVVEAADEDAALEVGLRAWDKKYGPNARPDLTEATVRITLLRSN